MNNVELKSNFHKLIDSYSNEATLVMFYEIMSNQSKNRDGVLWSNLSVDEQEELIEVVSDSLDETNLIDHSAMKAKHNQWLL
jgi:hypothetical protein